MERFIPTHVGFTQEAWADYRYKPVHPHACGVYELLVSLGFNVRGSSPRMWGLH